MTVFLLAFFSVYGGLHLYFFMKAKAALAPGTGMTFMLAVFLVLMVLAPIGVRLLDRHGLQLLARSAAYIGYTWMGLLFFFFWIGLCLDGINLFMRLLGLLAGSNRSGAMLASREAFLIVGVSALLLGCWSVINAWQIKLERLLLLTEKLPAQSSRFTIVQISDVHLGLLVGERKLERIIDLVRRAEPDLVVCTGDLVDAQMDNLGHLAGMLAELRPPLGKFAVFGNHEFYAGSRQSERFLRAAGFTLLRNKRHRLEVWLNLIGVDDPAGRNRSQGKRLNNEGEEVLLSDLDSSSYNLLLKHRPVARPQSVGRFDLQLSGHTHKGQLFPFSLITRLFYPKEDGLYPLDKNSLLHVSRGAGTWGPPMRFLSSPHVTLIELARAEP